METKGLIIRDRADTIVAVEACNHKSRTKTLERGELWIVVPGNGRVLPFDGGGVQPFGTFEEKHAWFEIEIDRRPDNRYTNNTATTGPDRERDPHTAAIGSGEITAENSAVTIGHVLSRLDLLIAERRRTLPEGSYTTHLFTQGTEKIRKKTGEEAVELILARAPAEIRSEAADLLYHLLVLLHSESIPFVEVVSELDRRHNDTE